MSNYEIERKFLLKNLPDLKYDKISYIEQYYLEQGDGYSDRVRRSDYGESVKYTRTIKQRISERTQSEEEIKISKKEFKELKTKSISVVQKYRHVINFGDYKWEIDKFENINLVIAEIEIVTDDHVDDYVDEINHLDLPKFIKENLIMEVSDFKPFSNKRLAIKI